MIDGRVLVVDIGWKSTRIYDGVRMNVIGVGIYHVNQSLAHELHACGLDLAHVDVDEVRVACCVLGNQRGITCGNARVQDCVLPGYARVQAAEVLFDEDGMWCIYKLHMHVSCF